RRRPRSTLFPYTTLFRSAAAALRASLDGLIAGAPDRALRSQQGEPLAVWIADRRVLEHGVSGGLEALAAACETVAPADPEEAFRSEEHTSELQSRENLVC